uniref:Uncharacterized protein n=1 Tax=Anguilla anguilla TaxID=7936 RepID=A0A0E9WK47_ANGAN
MLGLYCIRQRGLAATARSANAAEFKWAIRGKITRRTSAIIFEFDISIIKSTSCDSVQFQYIQKEKKLLRNKIKSTSLLILSSDINTYKAA